MEKSRNDPYGQKQIEIRSNNRNGIAYRKESQHKKHDILTVEPGENKGHNGTGKGNTQGKETDKQPGVNDGHIVTLGNIGQNPDKAHLRIEDAEHPCH